MVASTDDSHARSVAGPEHRPPPTASFPNDTNIFCSVSNTSKIFIKFLPSSVLTIISDSFSSSSICPNTVLLLIQMNCDNGSSNANIAGSNSMFPLDCAEFNNGLDSTELSNYLNPVDRAGAVGSGRFHYASVLGHLALRWPCWRGFLVDASCLPSRVVPFKYNLGGCDSWQPHISD
ncbi:hypothetical protein An09g03610 [Aspergillus niger]|uniref:Uncharacterized protein n=2 Tax=Aspergillus niger TaxID=5061 RepID=A2QTX6_ASPNC|nr:hypothetical protein An09g03610 [Aspergillus niger]CAK96804.1 hypothetical protein An09g03610 [Aspergillus niger]